VGKKVGVCAEPEILHWDIGPADKFAVVASDGVFEFITSQNVVEMLAKFSDPIEGAKHVVAEAYRLWLTYDDRTDDITMIVVYFEDVRPLTDPSGASAAKTPRDGSKHRPDAAWLLFDSFTPHWVIVPLSAGRMQRAMSISKGEAILAMLLIGAVVLTPCLLSYGV
jgi:hypothetical protein